MDKEKLEKLKKINPENIETIDLDEPASADSENVSGITGEAQPETTNASQSLSDIGKENEVEDVVPKEAESDTKIEEVAEPLEIHVTNSNAEEAADPSKVISKEKLEEYRTQLLEIYRRATEAAEEAAEQARQMTESTLGIRDIITAEKPNIDADFVNPYAKPKVSVLALGELKTDEIRYLQINDACIEVYPSRNYQDIIDGAQTAIALILDNRTYVSEPIRQIISDIFLLRTYTNLDLYMFEEVEFRASQVYDIYGLLVQENVIDKVKALINQKQLQFWNDSVNSTLNGIIAYRNSAAGIINLFTEQQQEAATDFSGLLDSLKNLGDNENVQNLLKIIEELNPQK